MSDIITSKKELAARLGRNPRYVRDMERGGFRLPCRTEDAVKFLRENPHPTRNRGQRRHVSRLVLPPRRRPFPDRGDSVTSHRREP